jgi:hypothetical protein
LILATCSTTYAGILTTLEPGAAALAGAMLAPNSGITITGATLTGNPKCSALFSQGQQAVPQTWFPDAGIVLSSGGPESLDMQDSGSQSTNWGGPGDADLDAILGQAITQDACVLELTFTAAANVNAIVFNYVFGSDEYTEYVDSSFNDAFALFLNGVNTALIPSTTTEVSINTVNHLLNTGYYNENENGQYPNFEADGFTTLLMAGGDVLPGTNTLKLAIADTSDGVYDSWVLIKAESLKNMVGGEIIDDPHVKTWSGEWFDFMGECDLVFIQEKNFEPNVDLHLHVRTTIRYEYSYIETAVLRIGDDVLEVASFGQYALNNIDQADLVDEEATLAGFPIYHTQKSPKQHTFDVVTGSNENITISTFKDMVSVKINGPRIEHFGQSVGIMGSVTGDMLTRDGRIVNITKDPNAFGQEWQVREDEPMLFRTARAPQAPEQQCKLPSVASKDRLRRRLANKSTHDAAEAACAHVGSQAGKEACIFDVIATSDLDIAKAGVY